MKVKLILYEGIKSKMTEEKTIYYYKQTGLPVRALQATLNGHQLTFTSRK
jgi:hypothetical protein